MKQIWDEIEFWIKANAPHLLNYLAPGATIQEIEAVEAKLSIHFPQAFKEFYMIHNGQIDESESLVDGHVILSLKRILNEWQVWTDLLNDGHFIFDDEAATSDPDPGINNDWWNPKWIPVTTDGCGNNFCIDMDPADGGKSGQIISIWHDAGWRQIKGDSFESWMVQYASDLIKGRYKYEEQLGIWQRED